LDEFWNEAYQGVLPFDDNHMPPECKASFYSDMSCDEYIWIFNKLMGARS